jgi:hypothetical protein
MARGVSKGCFALLRVHGVPILEHLADRLADLGIAHGPSRRMRDGNPEGGGAEAAVGLDLAHWVSLFDEPTLHSLGVRVNVYV